MQRGHLVIWSFVKIENGMSKSATIIINIYIYLIVSKNRVSEIENDQMTLTIMTTILNIFSRSYHCNFAYYICRKVVPLQQK